MRSEKEIQGFLGSCWFQWCGFQSFRISIHTLVIMYQRGRHNQSELKLSISSHSKPHTRLLKCFVLITLCCKTKHLRSLIRDLKRGFERLEILGLSAYLCYAMYLWFHSGEFGSCGFFPVSKNPHVNPITPAGPLAIISRHSVGDAPTNSKFFDFSQLYPYFHISLFL